MKSHLIFLYLYVLQCFCFRNPVYRTSAVNPSGYAENGVIYVSVDPGELKPFDQCKSGEKTPIFPIYKSTNLKDWEVAAEGALDTRPAWAKDDFSGSGIYKVHGDRYNLYYSATHKETNRLSLGVAWSDKVEGPYTSDDEPLETKFSLNTLGGFRDPSFFYDDITDTNYIIYNNNAGTLIGQRKIYIQNLTTDGKKTVGEPRELLKTSVKWEQGVIESASLIKRHGWYYLFYSAAPKDSGHNVIGVARADDVFGPYMKAAEPVMHGNERFLDTGSTSIVTHNCSSDVLVYNAYPAGHKYKRKGLTTTTETNDKMLMLDYILWDKGWPSIGWHGTPTYQHPHVYTLVGDGCCDGGKAMRSLEASASRTRFECMMACDHDPICEGFDVSGCKDDLKCKGTCRLYYGHDKGMTVKTDKDKCVGDGDMKCYRFDSNIDNENIFLMDDYTCARHMENLEVACVHHKRDCPRKRIYDFETCSRRCNRNKECESFIHDNQNNLCFLKKQTTQSGLVTAPQSYDAVLCAKERRFRVGEFTCQKGKKTSDRCIGTCPVTVNNEDECAARCHGMGGCAAFHFNNRRECFLKGLPQEIIPSDAKFGTRLCIKNDICEKGYLYMPGDVPGSGSNKYLTTGGIDSAEKCAEFCTKQEGCGSYEFSPSELKCNINTENEPTSRKIYKDYQFCSKEKTGKHASFIRYQPTDVRKAMEAALKKKQDAAKAAAAAGGATTTAAAVAVTTTTVKLDAAVAEEVEVAVAEAKTSTVETSEIATVLAPESKNWTLSVFIGTAVGFGLGYLVASLDRTFCRKRPEYASLLGDA